MFRWLRSKVEQLRSEAHAIPNYPQRQSETYIDHEITSLTLPDTHPPDGNTERISSLIQRLRDIYTRYTQLGEIDDLNEAIVLSLETLSLRPPGHPDRSISLNNLATYLYSRFNQLGGIDDLNEAIVLVREALSLRPLGHTGRPGSLNSLASYFSSRFELLGSIDDLNEAIILGREALSLCPSGHPDRRMSLNNFANDLSSRHKLVGEVGDLNEAIAHGREALSLCPPGHADRSKSLNNLTIHISSRYNQLQEIEDLNEVLLLSREGLSLYPHGHPDRSMSLNNLAVHLSSRYNQLGGIDDLNEAIILAREALSLRPLGHPGHSVTLNNLAAGLSSRYKQLGGIDDLNEAIVLDREALSLRPPGHRDRSRSLNNLAVHLSSRYKQLGGTDDLDEAIVLHREALSLCPPGHPDRSMASSNLAAHISSRYNQFREIDDLNEAIVLDRDALSHCPPGHPYRSRSLSNLAGSLTTRYTQLGEIDDLNEAILLAREALSLYPPGHPYRSVSLNNLASCLSSRYKQLREIDDVTEAIFLGREALSLRPPGHPDRSMALSNLAAHISSRYDQFREIEDLNEAIVFARDALSLCPPGHPYRSMSLNNLGGCLSSRYEHLGCIDDLEAAIVHSREAFSLCPPGHPDRSVSLTNLAIRLCSWYKHPRGTDNLDAAMEDKQPLFGLYTELEHVSQIVSTYDLLAARAWVDTAEEFHHSTTLSAYTTALRLLVEHSAALPPLPQRFVLLQSLSSSLAVDAFSACLRNQSPTNAVELLEQGRTVFWSQLTNLRSPLNDVIASGPEGKVLADEFERLTSLIRMALSSPDPGQHDRICNLNLELQKVVSGIRGVPGRSRFLLPLLFSDLQRAARDGPVIIVNASKYGCDALVMFVDQDPVHIPLPVTKEDVLGLTSKLHTLRRLAIQRRSDITTDFQSFLRELWDGVVSHIVDVLRLTCPPQSRIWWCPTAEFSLLPLHAAAPYRRSQRSVSDLYISSYTTTLTALMRAKQPSSPASAHGKKRFIAIGQATAAGASELHSVSSELDTICSQFINDRVMITRIERKDACISTVGDRLGKNEWVHFACHGVPNEVQPLMFPIEHFGQCNLQNPEFVYLSCHTAVAEQESPDEAIRLPFAMQFAGFPSVIGTMWGVDGSETNKVVSLFYKYMVDELGHLDHTRAAHALWMTLREVDIPMDQRILYIHLGA